MKLYPKMFELTQSDYSIGSKNFRLDCGMLNTYALNLPSRFRRKFNLDLHNQDDADWDITGNNLINKPFVFRTK